MSFEIPDLMDIIPGPIDSGSHIGCMVPGCGGMAAVMWVDRHEPWISILCGAHGRESLPSTWIVANPVFFEDCPEDLRQRAEASAKALHAQQEAEEGV